MFARFPLSVAEVANIAEHLSIMRPSTSLFQTDFSLAGWALQSGGFVLSARRV